MISVSQKPNYPDSGICLYARAGCFSPQNRSWVDSGNLASIAHHRHHRHCHYHRFPYLEAQTR